jgi:hypothetical protein
MSWRIWPFLNYIAATLSQSLLSFFQLIFINLGPLLLQPSLATMPAPTMDRWFGSTKAMWWGVYSWSTQADTSPPVLSSRSTANIWDIWPRACTPRGEINPSVSLSNSFICTIDAACILALSETTPTARLEPMFDVAAVRLQPHVTTKYDASNNDQTS